VSEEQERALRAFEEARKRMLTASTVSQGAIKAETVYVEAYQGLVRAGLAPQIKAKYHPKQVAHTRRAGG